MRRWGGGGKGEEGSRKGGEGIVQRVRDIRKKVCRDEEKRVGEGSSKG